MSQEIVLSNEIIKIIKNIVLEIKSNNNINSIVKDAVFQILEKKCTVIYYPLSDEKNRGFHIKRLVNDKLEDFVYINTDKTIEQQVFTAAHELGHIYKVYDRVVDLASGVGIDLDINDQDYEEKVTDRFAAEFIMPENEFIDFVTDYATNNNFKERVLVFDMLKLIAKLMDDFMSPFNAVRKRLYEIEAIDAASDQYLRDNKIELEKYVDSLKNDENSLINGNTGVKTISGLRSFIDKASSSVDTDKVLIKKIKKEFGLEDIVLTDQIVFSGARIE